MIKFFEQEFSEEMKDAAVHALQNERFVLGESVAKFEEAFAKYLEVKYCVSVSSGTSALKIALLSLGLKPKEKVATTDMTFIATSNSIIHAWGTPVLADINEHTGLVDPAQLKKVSDAKGVIPVHLYGQPCNMDELKELAEEKNWFVVEDACQAHGATFNGKKAGSIGDAGAFSFYAAKNMTVGGDGGMISTNNEEVAKQAKIYRDCGRTSKYEHSVVGFTERLNTVSAAIGIEQLKRLDEWVEKRQKVAELYRKNLNKEVLLDLIPNSTHAYHLFVIRSKEKAKIEAALQKNEVQYGVHYPLPLNLQPIYKQLYGFKGGEFPQSEKFANEILSLPVYPKMKSEDVLKVCEVVNGALQ
ncbi:MAG: DegT/DnrJ/EryC1/StrS family aminotransferase [Candidatus Diapherotrites archaeon]